MNDSLARSTAINSALRQIHDSGETVTQSGKRVKSFPVGMTEASGKSLRELLVHAAPRRTFETGFALGLASAYILDGHIKAGTASPGCHVIMDPFQRSEWGNAGLHLLDVTGCRNLVEFMESDSAIALAGLLAKSERFQWAFVDGGHLFENVFLDLYYAHRLVEPGGMVVVDDLWMPAVRTAIAYFQSNWGTTVTLNPNDLGLRRFAILTIPSAPSRPWDHFAKFTDFQEGGTK